MSEDPSIGDYLRRVLARDPDNVVIRLQLAGLLLDEDPQAALAETQRVLAGHPTDELALRLAIQAAADAGEHEVAEGYRRLIAALTDPPQSARVPVATDPVTPDGSEDGDEFDAFLREVLAEDARGRVTLDDVGGLREVKHRLEVSFLGPMRNPELRAAFGSTLRGGLLLYGPPGCGKTFLARAVAGELGAHFLAVGLHDVLDMWLGNSEKNLHAVFDEARRQAPCVLFLDEVDALGQKRSHLTHSAGRNVVVQLLSELDSLTHHNEGLFVLGATNAPWDLDPALRRPGRFDRSLLVLPPDTEARRAILAYHLRDRPVLPGTDLEELAARTDGLSGADLRLVCETAAETALGESVSTGEVRPITGEHLDAARTGVQPSTLPWFQDARNHALFANADGEYDELLAWMHRYGLA